VLFVRCWIVSFIAVADPIVNVKYRVIVRVHFIRSFSYILLLVLSVDVWESFQNSFDFGITGKTKNDINFGITSEDPLLLNDFNFGISVEAKEHFLLW